MAVPIVLSILQNRRARLMIFALVGLVFFLAVTTSQSSSHPSAHGPYAVYSSSDTTPTSFHYIIPATRSNKNLCRLLLSGTALNFPTPVFINWGAEEDPDPYKVHMQKVNSILSYLDTFAPDRHDDLVFILDGYDIWLQLPPDVIIRRYYEIIDAGNERLRQRIGGHLMEANNIYQSIVFGPDKICWPEDPKRFACWAVADSTLPRWAFGPETDTGKWRHLNRPRWLNSGTIIGPLGDVRNFFQATLDLISTNYTVDSDQFYMSNIYGVQEYARSKLAGDLPADMTQYRWHTDGWGGEGHMRWVTLNEPVLGPENTTEYHITIDYESSLFQTVAYYNNYISWEQFDGTQPSYTSQAQAFLGDGAEDQLYPPLPDDLRAAAPPFAIQGLVTSDGSGDPVAGAPTHLNWTDVSLGINTASKKIWAAIHFTPPKHWRDLWWDRMWYAPYAESIIRHANPKFDKPYLVTRDGREWWPYIRDDEEGPDGGRAGGGYADTGRWLGWQKLCGAHEDAVFHNAREAGEKPIPDWRPMPEDFPVLPESQEHAEHVDDQDKALKPEVGVPGQAQGPDDDLVGKVVH